MSCDLSDPALKETYEEIKAENTETNWMIAGYRDTKDVISLYEKGSKGFDEMRDKILAREEVLYTFVRLDNKCAFITYISDKATGVKRARALVHGRAVGNLFKDNNLALTLTTPQELSEANIRGKLRLEGPARAPSINKAKPSATNLGLKPKSTQNLAETNDVSLKKSIDNLATPKKAPEQPPSSAPVQQKEPVVTPPKADLPSVPTSQPAKYVEPPTPNTSKDEENHSVSDHEVSFLSPQKPAEPALAVPTITKQPSLDFEKPKEKVIAQKHAEPVAAPKPLSSDNKLKNETENVLGFIHEQVGSLWKRRYYRVENGKLVFLSLFPTVKPSHSYSLASIAETKRADALIIVRNSLMINFASGTKEYNELKGEPLCLYADDSASLDRFLKVLKN